MPFKQALAKAASPIICGAALLVFTALVVAGGTWWRDAAGVAICLVVVIVVRFALSYGQPYEPYNKRSEDA